MGGPVARNKMSTSDHSSELDVLSQVDLPLNLLTLYLRGDGHATSKDHVDLFHLLIIVGGLAQRCLPYRGSWATCAGGGDIFL
jgi:hypothetical protein